MARRSLFLDDANDGPMLGPAARTARVFGWLLLAFVILFAMSTCMGYYESPHSHSDVPMYAFIAVVVGAIVFTALDGAILWGAAWRFLFSPGFRRSTREHWNHASRSEVATQVAFAVFCFLVINVFIGSVLWLVFGS